MFSFFISFFFVFVRVHGSMSSTATTTTTMTVTEEQGGESVPPVVRVVLRAKPKKKGVQWAPDTVDNENAGKKSSKKCCIYHKPRAFGESSSESESSCDDCH